MIIQGFKTSAVAAGIKTGGAQDLGLIWSEKPAVAAAVFTQNAFIAAPLVVSKKHLQQADYRVRALLVNSGNANAATGETGIRAAQECAEELAGASFRLTDASPQNASTADVVVGTKGEPGGKMPSSWPLRHIPSDFSK